MSNELPVLYSVSWYIVLYTSANDGLRGGMTAVPGGGWSKIPSRFPASGFMKSTGVESSLPLSRGAILFGCMTGLSGSAIAQTGKHIYFFVSLKPN